MQRQSLGSPNSKPPTNLTGGAPEPEEDLTAEKLIRSPSPSSRTVHLIPLLVLVCFVILYLISHEPSTLELPITRGINRVIDQKAGSLSDLASAAIRTKRGLMEENRLRYRRLGNL